MEMVSIIVPVYKVEKYLDRCMESIVNQTYRNLEIVLVDDGSPDCCPQMCDAWAKKDARIRVLHNENGGVSSARNAALDAVIGEYVCFVDGDDYVELEMLEKLLNCIEAKKADIVIYNARMVTDEGNFLGVTENIREGLFSAEEIMHQLMKGEINHYAWNKLFKKQVLEGIRFPEGRVWEDVATTFRMIERAKRIYCYPEAFYNYVQRENSIVRTINEKALRDIFLARVDCYCGVKEKYPEAAQAAFDHVVASAMNLYDRSLWATVDNDVLEEAKGFLSANCKEIRANRKNKGAILFLSFPGVYNLLRRGKHLIGNLVRKLRA